jgi:hypothetical protein
MILTKLTPAETLIVRHGQDAPLREMLKYTMMDLLLKQVIAMEDVEWQRSTKDPLATYKYIIPGKNFDTYRARSHENVFLFGFVKTKDIRYLFRHFVKMAYQDAKTSRHYQSMVRRNDFLAGMFDVSFFQLLFGGFSYTDAGLELRMKVEKEIEVLERTLPDLMTRDREAALDALREIGGNVFLLKGLNFELSREIEEALLNEIREYETTATSGGCGTGCFTTWHHYGGDFDSSCSSDSGGDSSGGDSGCGGDGCGGGCGGGD